jgi:two-component system aerobic respiration control sensor histidine kinase ArcB
MKKILVVEDEKLSAMLTQSRLEENGCQVFVAYTGAEALELFDNSFDLVVLDLGLPDITGFEVARQIRSREPKDQHTPIVALTAQGAAEAKAACLNAGIDEHIEKPLDRAKLFNLLSYLSKEATNP